MIIYLLSREEAEMKIRSLYKASNRSGALELLDDHLKTVLANVRLVYLLEREGWDSTPNWEDILSLGEQQRLGMARLFFHHPKFGILDECTKYVATSVDVEEHLYRLATSMGITVITSSHRPALIPFQSVELKLIDGEGNWELCEIQHLLTPPARVWLSVTYAIQKMLLLQQFVHIGSPSRPSRSRSSMYNCES
ncbi:ABC transporter D family member 1-like [Aegilops tauschii subsp. strangulata]|uniref:ABC transporter D family member 1-like n=1 Tax=Aegilops tauschii subsp. strangulata TaxID=200361 RepID=UPI00098BC0A4|nr:ABC transporter D family member 1-like [Aegilops tauschii subsp. strangulata]